MVDCCVCAVHYNIFFILLIIIFILLNINYFFLIEGPVYLVGIVRDE